MSGRAEFVTCYFLSLSLSLSPFIYVDSGWTKQITSQDFFHKAFLRESATVGDQNTSKRKETHFLQKKPISLKVFLTSSKPSVFGNTSARTFIYGSAPLLSHISPCLHVWHPLLIRLSYSRCQRGTGTRASRGIQPSFFLFFSVWGSLP